MIRPADDAERAAVHARFSALCAVRSVSGEERRIADLVTAELRSHGLAVVEDDTAAESGAGAGNLLCRVPGVTPGAPSILLCAHLDTVPHEGVVVPVHEDGAWTSDGTTILGADNKAALAVMLTVVERLAREPGPVGVELLLTTGEETALAGSTAFEPSVLRSTVGYVFDQASPIGEIVLATPAYFRIEATFLGAAAHAGIRPETGRSAVRAAARAITGMPHGRLDEGTTANVGHVRGGPEGATNVVPGRCVVLAEARALDPGRADAVVAQIVDAVHDAANDPTDPVDVDVRVERLFGGYRQIEDELAVRIAAAALRARGYVPRPITSGGGSDANAIMTRGGPPVVNLANGTERNHEPCERVTDDALEGMLDVGLALLDAAADLLALPA